MRWHIKSLIEKIPPFDELEETTIQNCINWIGSEVEIFRLKKPATPPKHLVSYFLLVDGEYVLLVDHKKANLWLPSGEHIEKDEDPKAAVIRECKEELNVQAEFLRETPLFITETQTNSKTNNHTDVSLWYILKGNKNYNFVYDKTEFHGIKWFHIDHIPYEKSDPQMARFIQKLKSTL